MPDVMLQYKRHGLLTLLAYAERHQPQWIPALLALLGRLEVRCG